jgi:hypothetical protein
MRSLLALFLLATLALFLAGCSGGAKSRANHPTVLSSSSNCDFKQITAGARREGTCAARGVAITVVNRAHRLHGREYDARVLSVRRAKRLGQARANGTFVIVGLRIKNTLAAPHEFDRRSDLVFLLVDKKYFGESREAEGNPALSPFRLRRADLQPDETATGTVVFDLPLEHAKHLFAQGSNLIFVNSSDEAKQFPTGTQPLKALGYVRLWK